ncbi:MAG: hypothetical protein KKH41_02970 [Candidatus Thermoplasmatota archaeon]|nr:hypothetical protein [Euryarchaeota archaeon]MBU4591526.1 hypothetical protein [Candidatus Thermoplasmatota archaeon]
MNAKGAVNTFRPCSPSLHSSGLLTGRWEYVSVRNRALFWQCGAGKTKSSGEASRVAGGGWRMVALQVVR